MTPDSLKGIKVRILFISLGFVAFFCLLLFRGYQLQIAENVRVNKLANRQYTATLPVKPKRGGIYDRNGTPLALDVEVVSIAVHPQLVSDKSDMAQKLSQALDMPKDKVLEKLNSNKKFEWLARRVEAGYGQKVGLIKDRSLTVIPEYKRFYPNKELAGNVLGAVGYDSKALAGLEMSMDKYLKAESEKMVVQKDARGKLYTPLDFTDLSHDVYLTLDINVQYMTEKYLDENARKFNVKSGFGIVMDPKTGEVLAMANYPRINPNVYWEYPMDQWKNHAVTDSFEPGSTFKSVMAAAALDLGKAKPNDLINCEGGSYQIGSHVIHDSHPHGSITFTEVMQVSSNIGVTKLGARVGKTKFYDAIQKLGFGKKSGLNLPGEEPGVVSNYSRWSDIDFSNISFGQGVAVNGMQMAQAYSTLANNGLRMKPYLVSKVVGGDGKIAIENNPTPVSQVFSAHSTHDLTQMLKGVVDLEGTGKLAMLDGYDIAGKTGTAQKVNPVTKTYDANTYFSSFIGYVPADSPKYVIFIAYDSPSPQYYGGVVAAPVFKSVAMEALAYSGVAPKDIKLAKTEEPKVSLNDRPH